jgi:hypothetical protein
MTMGYNASDEIDYRILVFLALLKSSTRKRLCFFNIPLSFGIKASFVLSQC